MGIDFFNNLIQGVLIVMDTKYIPGIHTNLICFQGRDEVFLCEFRRGVFVELRQAGFLLGAQSPRNRHAAEVRLHACSLRAQEEFVQVVSIVLLCPPLVVYSHVQHDTLDVPFRRKAFEDAGCVGQACSWEDVDFPGLRYVLEVAELRIRYEQSFGVCVNGR